MQRVYSEVLICGGTLLYRARCPECDEYNLSGNHDFYCRDCDNEYSLKPVSMKSRKVSSSHDPRNFVSRGRQRQIISEQNHECFWCGRKFGTWYNRKGLSNQLSIRMDHVVPYSFTQNSKDENIVASCNLCNSWKTDLVFSTISDCKQYLRRKWEKDLDKHKIIVADENGDFFNAEY